MRKTLMAGLQGLAFVVLLLLPFRAQSTEPVSHTAPSTLPVQPSVVVGTNGLILIPNSSSPDLVRRYLEENAATLDARFKALDDASALREQHRFTSEKKRDFLGLFAAYYDARIKKPKEKTLEQLVAANDYLPDYQIKKALEEDYQKDFEKAVAVTKVDPSTLSYKATEYADEGLGYAAQKYLLGKLRATLPRPTGEVKKALDALQDKRVVHPDQGAHVSGEDIQTVSDWAMQGVIANAESNPSIAEAYYRMNEWARGHAGSSQTSQQIRAAALERAQTWTAQPFKFVDIPATQDSSLVAKAMSDNLQLFNDQIKEVENPANDVAKLLQRFGPYYRWRTGAPINANYYRTHVKDLREEIERQLTSDYLNRFYKALHLTQDDKDHKLPIDVLLMADRICFNNHKINSYSAASCYDYFGSRVAGLVSAQQRAEEHLPAAQQLDPPRQLLRLRYDDYYNRGDFDDFQHSDFQRLHQWAEDNAKKYKTSNPELATALSMVVARIDRERDSHANVNAPPDRLYQEAYFPARALASITGSSTGPALAKSVHFTPIPRLTAVGNYDNDQKRKQTHTENYRKLLPVMAANRDEFYRALQELESWNPATSSPEAVRQHLLEKYAGYLPANLRQGAFDIDAAKKAIIKKLGEEFLAIYAEADNAMRGGGLIYGENPHYTLPPDITLLADRLQGEKNYRGFVNALSDTLVKAGMAKDPGYAWFQDYDKQPNEGAKSSRYNNQLSEAQKLFVELKRLHDGTITPQLKASLQEHLNSLLFHPAMHDPDVSQGLGLLNTVLHHDNANPEQSLVEGPNRLFLGSVAAHEIDPVVHGPVAVHRDRIHGPVKAIHQGLDKCPGADTARANFYRRAGKPQGQLFGSIGTPFEEIPADASLEERISLMRINKQLTDEALIAMENEFAIGRQEYANQHVARPEDLTYVLDMRQLVIENFRRQALNRFKALFDQATAGRDPNEKLSYPADVLLLLDRIGRSKNADVTQNMFVAKCISLLHKAKLPDSQATSLASALELVYQTGRYPADDTFQLFFNLSMNVANYCLYKPADCDPETANAMFLLADLVGDHWKPLKAGPPQEWDRSREPHKYDGHPDQARLAREGWTANFRDVGSNRQYIEACAREQMLAFMNDPALGKKLKWPLPSELQHHEGPGTTLAETSWKRPQSYRSTEGQATSTQVTADSPFLVYPPHVSNVDFQHISARNLALTQEALDLLRNPQLSYEDFQRLFGPYYAKKVGALPSKAQWDGGARAESLLETRNALLKDSFNSYYTQVNDATHARVANAIYRHPASGFGTAQAAPQIDRVLKELEHRSGEAAAAYAQRREKLREWLIQQFDRDGIHEASEQLGQTLALALEALEDQSALEAGRPRPAGSHAAKDTIKRAQAEVAKRKADPRRAMLVDVIAKAFADRGHYLPAEVRLWILDDEKNPAELEALTHTLLKYEPAQFEALLLDHEAGTARPTGWLGWMAGLFHRDAKPDRDQAITKAYQLWGKFTLLAANSPQAEVENRRRAKEALALLDKYPFTEGEVDRIFGEFHKERTGWSFLDELQAHTLSRADFSDPQRATWAGRVASKTDKLGLEGLLLDQMLGISRLVQGSGITPMDLLGNLQTGRQPASESQRLEAARERHGQVWRESAERRGILLSLGREYWRPNEDRAEGLKGFARLLFVPQDQQGPAQESSADAQRAEVRADRLGNTLTLMREFRGKTPTEAELSDAIKRVFFGLSHDQPLQGGQVDQAKRYADFFKLARDFENHSPTGTEVENGLHAHLSGFTAEDREDAHNIAEALRLARMMGDLRKKEGNPLAADPDFDLYKRWADTWYDKIQQDGLAFQRLGATRLESKAHEQMLIARNEIERMIGKAPSLTMPPETHVQSNREPVTDLKVFYNPYTHDVQFLGMYNYIEAVVNAKDDDTRASLLRQSLNISVVDRYRDTFRPSLHPADYKPEKQDFMPPLKPWDQHYIEALEKARGGLMCEMLGLRDGYPGYDHHEEQADPGSSGHTRPDPVKMQAHMAALVRGVASLELMMIRALPSDQQDQQYAGMRQLLNGNMHDYQQVLFTELDETKLANSDHCMYKDFYTKIRPEETQRSTYYTDRTHNDDLFIRWLQTYTDDWYSSRGYQQDSAHWDDHLPKDTYRPDWLDRLPNGNGRLGKIKRFGYGRMLHLVPEEVPEDVRRALAALPADRQQYYLNQWSSTDPITHRPTGIQMESHDLIAKAHQAESFVRSPGFLHNFGVGVKHVLSVPRWIGHVATLGYVHSPTVGDKEVSDGMHKLDEAGQNLQKASDLRQAWYEAIVSEYWNTHSVGNAGIPPATRQELRRISPFMREQMIRYLEDQQEKVNQLLSRAGGLEHQNFSGNRAQVDALRKQAKQIRLQALQMVYQPWAEGIIYANWKDPDLRDRMLNLADHEAHERHNLYAQQVIAKLRDWQHVSLQDREALRGTLLQAFQSLQTGGGQNKEFVKEDQNLANFLAAFKAIMDDDGLMAKAWADKDFRDDFEAIRQGNHRFNPYVAMEALQKERQAYQQACEGTGPRPPNCEALAREIQRMHDDGYGLGSEARMLLLDSQKMQPEQLDGLERAEHVLANYSDPSRREDAKKSLLYLRLAPSAPKVAQTLNLWDHDYQDYLATQRKRTDLSEEIIKTLVLASRGGSAVVKILQKNDDHDEGKVVRMEIKQCKDVRPRTSSDVHEWDFVTDLALDQATASLLDSKLREMARLSAYIKAHEFLSRDGKTPKQEDLKRLTDENFVHEYATIGNDLRIEAAQRLLHQNMGPGRNADQIGFENPQSPIGCALRALLGPVNRDAALISDQRDLEAQLHQAVTAVQHHQDIRNPELTARIESWGPPDTPAFKAAFDAEIKRQMDAYVNKADFHLDIDAEYAKAVGQRDHGILQKSRLVLEQETKAKVKDSLYACVDHYENDPHQPRALPRAEIVASDDVEAKAKALQEEIKQMQLVTATTQREVALRSLRIDPTFGTLKNEIDFLWHDDKDSPGHIQRLQKDLDHLQETYNRKHAKELKDAMDELQRTMNDYRMRLATARSNLYRERLRLEAVMSQPLEGRKTIEEEDLDDKVKRLILTKIGNEIDRLFAQAKADAAAHHRPEPTVKPFPSREFLAGIENDPEVRAQVADFIHKKMDAQAQYRAQYEMPQGYPPHGDDVILTQLKGRSLARQAEVELRLQRIENMRRELTEVFAGQTQHAYTQLGQAFKDYAEGCMQWLEQNKGLHFDRVPGPTARDGSPTYVYRDEDKEAIGNLLQSFQLQRQQLEALTRAMQPPAGVDAFTNPATGPAVARGPWGSLEAATQNHTMASVLDQLKHEMTDGAHSMKVPADKVDKMVHHDFDAAQATRLTESQELEKTMQDLACVNIRWNGLAVTWGTDLSLGKIGTPACPKIKNVSDLRALLEKTGKFGRYAIAGGDGWQDLVSAIWKSYTENTFQPLFELGNTAVRIQERSNYGGHETVRTATGYVGDGQHVHDFLTDMDHAENYLVFTDLATERAKAQSYANSFRQNMEEYSRRRRDLIGGSNRVVPIGVDSHGLDVEGRYMTRKWKALNDTHAALGEALQELEHEYGAISFDWENGGQNIRVRAHTLAATLGNQKKYLTDPDFFKNVPNEVFKNIEARRKFLEQTLVIEIATLPLDFLSGGAAEIAKGSIWGSRMARIARVVSEVSRGVRSGLRLAQYSALLGKAINDLYGNIRYGTFQGQPEVGSSWDQTLKGAAHSRWIFGLLPVVNASLAAGLEFARVPASVAPYISGPLGMYGTSFGVELGYGQDPRAAMKNAEHSIFLGMPFGEILGKVASKVPLLSRSPVLQKWFGGLGTYAIFSGQSLYRAHQEMEESGTYINPFSGEEVKADDVASQMTWDTIFGGAFLDGYFAWKAAEEIQSDTARNLLRAGVSPDGIRRIYGKEADLIIAKALAGFRADEVRKLRQNELRLAEANRQNPFDRTSPEGKRSFEQLQGAQTLLDAIAAQMGFANKDQDNRAALLHYLDQATGGGDRYVTMSEIGERIKNLARADLQAKVIADHGASMPELLNNSVFYQDGRFDPDGFSYIPAEYLQAALGHQDGSVRQQAEALAVQIAAHRAPPQSRLGALVQRMAMHWGTQRSRVPYFGEFLKNYKLDRGMTTHDVGRIFRNADAASMRRMLLEKRLTPEGLLASFPPAEISQALGLLTVADVAKYIAAAKDPRAADHNQAALLIAALAHGAGMDPGTFLLTFDAFSKGTDRAPAVLATFGGPSNVSTRQQAKMSTVLPLLGGPVSKAVARDLAISDPVSMDHFVADTWFREPGNFNVLPPRAFDLKKPSHVEYAQFVARAMADPQKDPAMASFYREFEVTPDEFVDYFTNWLRNHKNEYDDLPTAVRAAKQQFRVTGRQRITAARQHAAQINPLDQPQSRTATQLREGVSALLTDRHVRALAKQAAPNESAPTNLAIERTLTALEGKPNGDREAILGIVQLVHDFPAELPLERDGQGLADPSAAIVKTITRHVIASHDPQATIQFLQALNASPNGGRFMSLVDPRDLATLAMRPEAVQAVAQGKMTDLLQRSLQSSQLLDSHRSEGERLASIRQQRDLLLAGVEVLQGQNTPASLAQLPRLSEMWRATLAAARDTARVDSPLQQAIDSSAKQDLIQLVALRRIDPRLIDRPDIHATVRPDGALTLGVTVVFGDQAKLNKFKSDLLQASVGIVSGEMRAPALEGGGYRISFSGVKETVSGGQKTFVDRVINLLDALGRS